MLFVRNGQFPHDILHYKSMELAKFQYSSRDITCYSPPMAISFGKGGWAASYITATLDHCIIEGVVKKGTRGPVLLSNSSNFWMELYMKQKKKK
jgi:hypothetical protein